ncbi:hypothetical protein [Aminipila sp.]|uniref:hypothetical protein n=1 Tax=Aminipila sp. TaxID=2060095 RepID=UPI00289B9D9F|nr:hypothetical protein [Aminipila sp.]
MGEGLVLLKVESEVKNMGIPCKWDPGYDPNAEIRTLMKKSSQPALRADVIRAGEVLVPGSLTCSILY